MKPLIFTIFGIHFLIISYHDMSLEAITSKVQEMAEAADSLGSSIKFVFTGGEGVVYLDGTSDPNTVSNEDKDADCTISVDIDDFNSMITGDLNPMAAFMSQKLSIDGDMGVAMKLGNLFG